MQIAIISGSHRQPSQSAKVARFVQDQARQNHPDVKTELIELAGNPLPLWDEGKWSDKEPWPTVWEPIAQKLRASDGFVVVSPEWHGMVPPGLKNFMLLWTAKEVGHKPGMLVGVSAGMGGAYPINELRTSGYKNSFICWTPEHVIVRYVEKLLNPGPAVSADDTYIRDRLAYSFAILTKYAEGLALVRNSGLVNREKYPNGM